MLLDGFKDSKNGIPEPAGEMLVVLELGELYEVFEAETEHLRLGSSGLYRRARHHHDELQQEAFEELASLGARAVNVDEKEVDDPRRLPPVPRRIDVRSEGSS